MLRGVFVAAVLLSLLASCAAPNYQLANNKGQTARCSSFGAGIVGTLMAVSMAQTCVNEYPEAGLPPGARFGPGGSLSAINLN